MNDILKKQLEKAMREAKKVIADPYFHIGYDWEARIERNRGVNDSSWACTSFWVSVLRHRSKALGPHPDSVTKTKLIRLNCQKCMRLSPLIDDVRKRPYFDGR